jgi:cation transporter-like permease
MNGIIAKNAKCHLILLTRKKPKTMFNKLVRDVLIIVIIVVIIVMIAGFIFGKLYYS